MGAVRRTATAIPAKHETRVMLSPRNLRDRIDKKAPKTGEGRGLRFIIRQGDEPPNPFIFNNFHDYVNGCCPAWAGAPSGADRLRLICTDEHLHEDR